MPAMGVESLLAENLILHVGHATVELGLVTTQGQGLLAMVHTKKQ
jgi:hypothetical protein